MKYLIKQARIVDPANNFDAVSDLLIESGKIAKIENNIEDKDAYIIDAKGLVCAPGFIDLHVHLREPGFEGKETILTGTRSAVKGGYTTICMMPNTNPTIDNVEIVEKVKKIIEADAKINVKIIAAATKDRKGHALTNYKELKAAGVVAVSDDGSPIEDLELMKHVLKEAKEAGLIVSSHAEDLKLVNGGVMNEGFISSKLGLSGISNESEYKAIEREAALAKETGAPLHICHVSTKESCEIIAKAKKEGVKITAEATPHHFTLTEKECESFSGNTKMNPPLRADSDVAAIKQALKDGTLDAIATDHAPHAPHENEVEFDFALFGIIGLETAFSLSFQNLVEAGVIDLKRLIELMSLNPARIFNLEGGTLSVGSKADITLIDLNKEWIYIEDEILSSSRNTPYIGRKMKGMVKHVFVSGNHIFKEGHINE